MFVLVWFNKCWEIHDKIDDKIDSVGVVKYVHAE